MNVVVGYFGEVIVGECDGGDEGGDFGDGDCWVEVDL